MNTSVLAEGPQAGEDVLKQALSVAAATSEQERWSATPLKQRLAVLRRGRHELALLTEPLSNAISPVLARIPADTRVSEILPLLEACRFLERSAGTILAPRRLGGRGRPMWLAGVTSEVHRDPLGHVLVIGPANYPLFLPGVQALQALAAGNMVTWKPGRGGKAVAELFAETLFRAGLSRRLLTITEESIAATNEAIDARPDKVFFTGSAATGRILMRRLAETLTPSVMELSGSDALVVLPSADLPRVVAALTFGMRLNGSATCMAPRRVLLLNATNERRAAFLAQLQNAFATVAPIHLPETVRLQLVELADEARYQGATVHGDLGLPTIAPILLTDVTPSMRIAQADLFSPVLSVIEISSMDELLAAQQACPFALTAAIFGDEQEARSIAARLNVGTVSINDLIVPTVDPRVPFGGRRQSGFGSTRGAEGLLEMTTPRTVAVRHGRSTQQYEATTVAHEGIFDGLIAAIHAGSWAARWHGVKQLTAAARTIREKK